MVVNEFAEELEFRHDRTRARRDHVKFLTLIRTIALLHQHQREIKTGEHNGEQIEYVEATRDDIARAKELTEQVIDRSYRELSDKTELLLMAIVEMVHTTCVDQQINPNDYRFTRKMIHGFLNANDQAISATHLKRHLAILEDAEYLIVHSGGGRGRLKTYQLDYESTSTMPETNSNGQKSTSSPSEVLDFFPRIIARKNGDSDSKNGEVPKNENARSRSEKNGKPSS